MFAHRNPILYMNFILLACRIFIGILRYISNLFTSTLSYIPKKLILSNASWIGYFVVSCSKVEGFSVRIILA
jgi:hypothetical protein